MEATGASLAWSIWGAGPLRSRRFSNHSNYLQLVRPALLDATRSACSIITLAYTPTIQYTLYILHCTIHKARRVTLQAVFATL